MWGQNASCKKQVVKWQTSPFSVFKLWHCGIETFFWIISVSYRSWRLNVSSRSWELGKMERLGLEGSTSRSCDNVLWTSLYCDCLWCLLEICVIKYCLLEILSSRIWPTYPVPSMQPFVNGLQNFFCLNYIRQGGYVLPGIWLSFYLSLCLSVSNFAWNLLIGSSWQFYQRCILSLIHIWRCRRRG